MAKVYIPALMLIVCLLLAACPISGSSFSLLKYSYSRADQGSRDITSGDTVNFDVVLEYEAAGIIQIDFYWTYGIDDGNDSNYSEGQGPSYIKSGTDREINGTYTFNTGFTGVNWVTIKGVAFRQDGEIIVDKVWFNIDNVGPSIDADPRNEARVKDLHAITVRVADGGSDAGVAYDRTSFTLKAPDGNLVALAAPRHDGKGTYTASLVRAPSPGDYVLSAIAYDGIGNPTEHTSSFTLLATASTAPSLTIATPGWNGSEVSGTIQLSYASTKPIARLILDASVFGPDAYPYVFGSFPSTEYDNPSQSGTLSIDTTFTGQNSAYFRLFAIDGEGLSATSDTVWCRIRN